MAPDFECLAGVSLSPKARKLVGMQTTNVLINGHLVSAHDVRESPARFKADLISARETHGHALCLCRKPGLKLVIRSRNDLVHLAAWPDESHRHALDCPFFTEKEIQKINADRSSAPAAPASLPPNSIAPKNHLWDILHTWWDKSGLNRWAPGWSRDWNFARHMLLKNTEIVDTVNGNTLSANVFIPPYFHPEIKNQLEKDWACFTESMHRSPDSIQSIGETKYVLGILSSVTDAKNSGLAFKLRHHRCAFFMRQRDVDRILANSKLASQYLDAITNTNSKIVQDMRCIAFFKISATIHGNMHIVNAVFMMTSLDLIPVGNRYQAEFIHNLCDQNREFVRPLSHTNQSASYMPVAVLRDIDPSRQRALEVYIFPKAVPVHDMKRYESNALLQASNRRNDCLIIDMRSTETISLPPPVNWHPSL